MQPIHQILQTKLATMKGSSQPPVSATPSFKSSGNSSERINKAFVTFAVYYGHIWRSQFKNEHFSQLARNEWQKALVGFDDDIVERAIDECLKQRELPPTLSQFIECCKSINNRNVGFYQPKPEGKRNDAVAEEHLRQIRLILNMPIKSQEK